MEGAQALALTHPTTERKPGKRTRKPRNASEHWPPTTEAEAVLRRILAALSDAREAAGWHPARVRPGTKLRREHHGRLALRLHQLQEDGEDAPEALLVAVFRAKVDEQRRKDGPHGAGAYATAESLCRDAWWASNLAAGRAWLAGQRPKGIGFAAVSTRYTAEGSF